MPKYFAHYPEKLNICSSQKREQLTRKWQQLKRLSSMQRAQKQSQLEQEIEQASIQQLLRLEKQPTLIHIPEQLPIAAHTDAIISALNQHQVLVIAGETGSGKTTQLPKICLKAGRGQHGLIGHTQPRRLAASSVAKRIAQEINAPLGECVGYQVRFHEQCSSSTSIKLMTDGILLHEIQHDRKLLHYDTIIIDEAHERSLNIDFILGYLKQLLPKRPDLKVIITSATLDVARFSTHFNDAPIIQVSGRTYPVDVRYRPLEGEEPWDKLVSAIKEVCQEGLGDILIFQTGEREIRDTADGLEKLKLPHVEILPLYARLAHSQQQRIFATARGRRIVIATNIAETSLTVPGIRYVIDPGLARISRYSHQNSVQQLPIEVISQASANQRAGRCGRVEAGICIRLYSEDDFLNRPEFTDPEIQRTHLASVILRLFALNLGDINQFPFIHPPQPRHIQSGLKTLENIQALERQQGRLTLTPIGRQMAQFPIDPKLARVILASHRASCLREVLIIIAGLSIQDPRERPLDAQQAADECHKQYQSRDSDFMSFLLLWKHLADQAFSASALRKYCKRNFLSYLRIREWQDLQAQLQNICQNLKLNINEQDAEDDSIHQALLHGFITHIGFRHDEKATFTGTHQRHFQIFPGSALMKKPPKWVMSAQLTQTSKLFARINAKIQPQWVEVVAAHLVQRSYFEPHWSKKQGAVMAFEKTSLFGLVLNPKKRVHYSQIDPPLCRELFIRHALIDGDIHQTFKFLEHNQKLLDDVLLLEQKRRRHDILVDEQILFAFYDQKLPDHIVSIRHFSQWWKEQPASLLNYTPELLQSEHAAHVTEESHPDFWQQGALSLPLSYSFAPSHAQDGVRVHIPLIALNQVQTQGFEWLIPSLRHELITTLIKMLPKHLRKNFVPAPQYAQALLECIHPQQGPLLAQLSQELGRMTGVILTADAWDMTKLPAHLRMSFIIEDEKKQPCAIGQDLEQLKQELQGQIQAQVSTITENTLEQQNIKHWSFGDLPNEYKRKIGPIEAIGYPALQDDNDSVSIVIADTPQQQATLMQAGLRRLILLNIPSPLAYLQEQLSNTTKLGLHLGPYHSIRRLIDDCIACACDTFIIQQKSFIWTQEHFDTFLETVRGNIHPLVTEIAQHVQPILVQAHSIKKRLKGHISLELSLALTDIQSQLNHLIYPGFILDSGYTRLNTILRYLNAIEHRLDKLPQNPAQDRAKMIQVQDLQNRYDARCRAGKNPKLTDIRWMIEELRVSLFAQVLGTAYPISVKRVTQALNNL